MRFLSSFWSACLGNFFEHYDAALFGFLSPFLAPLIFPQSEPVTALILTYAMIPLGMLARPIGSLVFGYIGDRYGRAQALFLTLFGMGAVSLGIAVSPTYLQAGVIAPVIFCIGRILQNFFAAGESMGGAIYLLETIPEKKQDLFSSLYNASTIGGILLASGGVALLCFFKCVESNWRLLYLIGCATAIFGCLVRKNLNRGESQKSSIWGMGKTFWVHRKALGLIVLSSGFAYANYSMALVLMNGFVPLVTQLTKAQMISLNTGLLVFDFCALPFFGWLSSKISREKLMMGSAVAIGLLAFPLLVMLKDATLIQVIFVRICFVILGVAFFAPFHAWAQHLVPPSVRYSIISFGYALGSQALGGPTAAISLWLFKQTGMVGSVAIYWVFLAFACCLALNTAFKRRFIYE